MEDLIRLILTTVLSEAGLTGASFIILLLWTMRENKVREERYQQTIASNQEIIVEQVKKFDILKEIKKDVSELKSALAEKSEKELK